MKKTKVICSAMVNTILVKTHVRNPWRYCDGERQPNAKCGVQTPGEDWAVSTKPQSHKPQPPPLTSYTSLLALASATGSIAVGYWFHRAPPTPPPLACSSLGGAAIRFMAPT